MGVLVTSPGGGTVGLSRAEAGGRPMVSVRRPRDRLLTGAS